MSGDGRARDRYRSRSAADWRRFLDHRAVELAPTGSLIFVDVMMGDDGRMGCEAFSHILEQVLRELRDRGDLLPAEYAATAYPSWFRTLAEHREPFAPDHIGPNGERLVLDALRAQELPDPFWSRYHRDADVGAYGRAQAGFLRAFLEPSFRATWPERATNEQTALIERIFTAVAERIARDPAAATPRYRLVVGRLHRSA